MNEETTINGIDVSECEFYEEMRELPDNLNGGYYIQHCYCGLQGDNYCICNKNPNCYFKQLKRLQKENEELKARFNELYNNAEQLANKYNRCSGNKENELVEIINKTADEKNKYKQALEEIRELIQKCEIEDISCVQCKERKRCHCDLTRLLVEKIDEVLKNE